MDTTLIDLLGHPSPPGEPDPLTRRLTDLYRGGVKLERAAAVVGLHGEDATRRLQAHGLALPVPKSREAGPSVELLARLYLDEGLSTVTVAERVGLTARQVRYQLRRAGIRRRRPGRARTKQQVDRNELEDLYVRQRLTIRAIAARTGLHQRDVWRQLAEAGITRRPRGFAPSVDRETLWRLYVEEGRSVPATARALGVSISTVRHHLAIHRIPLRPDGRKAPSRRLVKRLYLDESLSPRQIAERLGLTQGQVRYDLVRLGIPRRRCGRPRRAA